MVCLAGKTSKLEDRIVATAKDLPGNGQAKIWSPAKKRNNASPQLPRSVQY